ncbi:MAG TPA: carboxylating nicotinate-nucleotide diphosphorylase [Terriglobia bacterium]|nr:carboxylating nicotinate-nucleotide diphosphorylase [Terriglobia bacterium]
MKGWDDRVADVNKEFPVSLDEMVQGLPVQQVRKIVARAFVEDLGKGDVTTSLTVPESVKGRGIFYSKQPLVVAGLPVAEEVFRMLEPDYLWDAVISDGTEVPAGQPLARVEGKAATLLSGERVALNFLQRLSGIATLTRKFKDQLAGLKTELLDTRKTTPGLRILEKYAIRMGGGTNHRMGLDDGILIKNNHIAIAGGIGAAIETVSRDKPAGMPVEVEVRTRQELEEAIEAGADIALLDNMTPEEVSECVSHARGRVLLEVSGGVGLGNIRAYAEAGVDRISVGALSHSAPAVDINFLIEPL